MGEVHAQQKLCLLKGQVVSLFWCPIPLLNEAQVDPSFMTRALSFSPETSIKLSQAFLDLGLAAYYVPHSPPPANGDSVSSPKAHRLHATVRAQSGAELSNQ